MKRKLLVIVMMGICGFPIANAQTSSPAGKQDGDTLNVGTVTVTALGTTKSVRKVGYSVSQVQGKGLVSSGESGVIQALTGKASNVQITKNAGDPGSGAYIQIRGQNTITGNTQPLIVVDGIPVSNSSLGGGVDGVVQQSRLNDLNPSDIESMEVLKGAAAAAVWGTRAANGVIVITTKRGKRGMKVEFSSTLGIDQVNREYEKQSTFGQGSNGKWVANTGGSFGDRIGSRSGSDSVSKSGQRFESESGNIYRPIIKKGDKTVYNDANRDQVFRNGTTWNNNLSISNATDKSSVFFSVADWNQTGVINGNSNYRRTSARLNFTQNMSDKLSIG
ncbi:MAG: TonB-dependent receptor plug domain-containing protein, partial [Bacteroidetes bacterium]|nr:TonB-dependent receptor plug domain-containing protein [Bacteroidota bacterium]